MQSLSSQLFAFGVTIIGGIILGLLFDVYRVARGVIRPKKIITHVGDLFFWILSTILIFTFLLFGNWGEVRFYVFIGIILGIFCYMKIFSLSVVKIILCIIKFFRALKAQLIRFMLFLYWVISYPVKLVRRIVLIPIGFFGGILVRAKLALKATKASVKKTLRELVPVTFHKTPPPE